MRRIIVGANISQKIIVQTCLGNDVSNTQVLTISTYEKNQFQTYDIYRGKVEFRGNPSPIYNCHGLTFASRRTGIHESKEISKILQDDNYQEIIHPHPVLPGDVVLYFSDDGDVEHSGIVICKPDDTNLNIPVVISKWGKYCEVIHWANVCPYDSSRLRYYRIIDNDAKIEKIRLRDT
ncbi:MAG: hypothetical protein L0229_18690 [Blastocatellia bacterium]|nr:hypothetical protein [Blastocatellia bacterium]